MRTRYLALAACFASIACLAQQPDTQQSKAVELLSALRSKDETVHDAALEQLRSDPAILQLPVVRSTLFEMLDEENREADQAMRKFEKWRQEHPTEKGADGGDGDEFFSWLVETAASVANWNDSHQVCILVSSGAVLDGRSSEETASHVKAAMPGIFQRSRSDVNINRALASETLVEALAKGEGALDPRTIKRAQQLILSNLHDPDAGVRSFTVGGLYSFGGTEVIPALSDVARSDPAIETQSDGKQWFPIREFATKAIAEIEKRASQKD